MPRWSNGAPKKLYILVVNATGEVLSFERRDARTAYVQGQTSTYTDGTYVFRTYIQETK